MPLHTRAFAFFFPRPALAHSSFTIRVKVNPGRGVRRCGGFRCVGWSKRCVQSCVVSACGAARCLLLPSPSLAQLPFRARRPPKAFSISSSAPFRNSSANPLGRRTSSPIRLASTSSPRRRRAPWHPLPDPRFACAAVTASIFRWPAAMQHPSRCARRFVRRALQKCSW